MKFVYAQTDSPKRSRQNKDCMVRAMMNATGVGYEKLYKIMYKHGYRHTPRAHMKAVKNGQPWEGNITETLKELGFDFVKHSFQAVKGKPRMTARMMASGDHPHYDGDFTEGIYILRVAKHLSCLIDGHLYDTWDCGNKCVYYAWEVKPKSDQ